MNTTILQITPLHPNLFWRFLKRNFLECTVCTFKTDYIRAKYSKGTMIGSDSRHFIWTLKGTCACKFLRLNGTGLVAKAVAILSPHVPDCRLKSWRILMPHVLLRSPLHAIHFPLKPLLSLLLSIRLEAESCSARPHLNGNRLLDSRPEVVL